MKTHLPLIVPASLGVVLIILVSLVEGVWTGRWISRPSEVLKGYAAVMDVEVLDDGQELIRKGKDLVIPERLTPMRTWLRGMGLARISRMSPQSLSKRRLIPPKRLVKRVVRAMMPAAMKVRYGTLRDPGGVATGVPIWERVPVKATPKKAIQRAGWTREEKRSARNRKNRSMSRQ